MLSASWWIRCRFWLFVLAVAWAVGPSPFLWTQARADGREASKPSSPARPKYQPRRVTRPRRPIVSASVLPAAKVTDEVQDNELVLGVVVNGAARAYPINMLTGPNREIINDRLGGKSIAATW